jgi:hypothetical protein
MFARPLQSLAALPSAVAPLSPDSSKSKTTGVDKSAASNSPDHSSARDGQSSSSPADRALPEHSQAPPPSPSPPSSQPAKAAPLDHIISAPTAPPVASPSPPQVSPPAATGIIHPPHLMNYPAYPILNRYGRSPESDDELKQKLDLTIKTEGAHSAIAIEQMCDLADRYIQTSKQELASSLIDQLSAAYAKLGSDDQHFLAQRLLNLSMRTQQNPGSGLRSQMLVTTVLLALNKGHWIDADGTLSGTLSNVAHQYMARQHLLQAEPVMKAALCLIDPNPANRLYTQMHLNMASLYERLTRYTEAEKEYRLALAGADTNQSVAYSQRSQVLNHLCTLYLRLNSKAKIQALLPDMISAAKEMQLQERYVFDQCLTQLVAHNYSAEAEQIIDAEIDSISQNLPQTARNNNTELLKSSVRKWSQDFVKAGNDGAAARIYEHWVQVIEQVYGANSFEAANTDLNAAKFMIEHDRFDRAHELIQKSLPIGSKLHDETFVKALAECGVALQNKHRNEDAERLLVEAMEMANAATRLNIQLSLGSMYSQQGSEEKAAALTTAIMGEVKEQFSSGDRDINAAIEEIVGNNLKHSDFSGAQLFIDLISSRKSRAYVVRNGLNLQQMDQTQTLDAIMQTYERTGDYAAAAKTCKLEIDKFADTLDGGTLRNLYKRCSNLLRLSGDQEAAQIYDTRANNVTDRPRPTPN